MQTTVFSTPRPMPSRRLPIAGSGVIILLALPVFLVAGWSVRGWALAAVLWVVVHGLDLLVARSGGKPGVQVFALLFKSIGLLAVLFAALSANRDVALAAACTYAVAYTFEFGLSLATYFGGDK
jgi:hypothetical protein